MLVLQAALAGDPAGGQQVGQGQQEGGAGVFSVVGEEGEPLAEAAGAAGRVGAFGRLGEAQGTAQPPDVGDGLAVGDQELGAWV